MMICSQKNEREKKKIKNIYWLRGILRFDAIRLPNSFKIPFNPFVWLCKHSVKLNSTKPNETKRNPRRKGCPHSGRPADGARKRSERERKENQYAKPFFVLKNNKIYSETKRSQKSWKVEKNLRGAFSIKLPPLRLSVPVFVLLLRSDPVEEWPKKANKNGNFHRKKRTKGSRERKSGENGRKRVKFMEF